MNRSYQLSHNDRKFQTFPGVQGRTYLADKFHKTLYSAMYREFNFTVELSE